MVRRRNEDDAYVAEAPELPGCAADAKTYAQALANAEVAIGEWICPLLPSVQGLSR